MQEFVGLFLCITILAFSFSSRNFSEDVLGWRESFDLLLSSKSE